MPVLRAAGVRYRNPHVLRHTYASLLLAQGESLAYVKDQLGHASIRLTVDLYGHLVPGGNRAAVDKLAVTIVHDAYLSVRGLSGYSGCSIRWLRDRLVDPRHPLPHFKFPGGKILIRKSQFDSWLAKYRRVAKASRPTGGAKTPAP